jgi:nitrite reductase/ring-hydroxylating ferredoxin subunit
MTTDPGLARAVPHAGTYRRELPVSLERLYENALDWEHLPYLHRASFSSVACIDAGAWGWRADVGLQPDGRPIVLELALDRDCRRWITRTLEGAGAGTEIWTHAFALGPRTTEVVVDFFLPAVDPARLASIGELYRSLYAQLYDEDESMMVGRQAALDRRHDRGQSAIVALGARDALDLPMTVDVGGTPVCIVEIDGELVAYTGVCPHSLGPLYQAPVVDGVVQCPWHGYRFDVRSGVEVAGQRCRLPATTTITVDAGAMVSVSWRAP